MEFEALVFGMRRYSGQGMDRMDMASVEIRMIPLWCLGAYREMARVVRRRHCDLDHVPRYGEVNSKPSSKKERF